MRHLGKLNDVEVSITDHALSRLCEMRLTPDEIKAILFDPDRTHESKKYPGNIVYSRGDHALATILDHGVLVIKTALFSSRGAWVEAWLDGKLGEEREKKLLAGEISGPLYSNRA